MTNSSTEIMRDEEVILDNLIACIVTTVELGGEGTRQYMHNF